MKPEDKKVRSTVSESQRFPSQGPDLSSDSTSSDSADLWPSLLSQASLSFVEESKDTSLSHDNLHLEITLAQSKVQNLMMNLESSYATDIQKIQEDYKNRLSKFKALKQKWTIELDRRQKLREHVVAKYKSLYQDHQLKIKELKSTKDELSELNKKIKNLNQSSAERYEEDTQKYEDLKAQLVSSQDQILSLKDEAELYKQKYNSLGELLRQKKKQIQVLQESKKDLEYKNLKFELQDVEKETTNHLSTEKNKLESEVQSLKTKIESYEQRLELRNVQIEKRKEYIDELHDKIENEKNKLAENFANILTEKENLIQQNLNLTSEVGRLKSLVSESETNVKNHLRSLEVGEHNRKELISRIYKLEDRISELEKDNQALRVSLQLAQETIKNLKVESASYKTSLDEKTKATDVKSVALDIIKDIDFKLTHGPLFVFKEKLKSNIVKLANQLSSDELVPSYRRELESQHTHLLDLYELSEKLQDELKSSLPEL